MYHDSRAGALYRAGKAKRGTERDREEQGGTERDKEGQRAETEREREGQRGTGEREGEREREGDPLVIPAGN
jgi:hypothetical protein